ncbi:MAG: hypothetical protein M3Z06_13335 [Actinomycetota bacterium]|nr:hypothetical protein [Actinomycetota bacterium]
MPVAGFVTILLITLAILAIARYLILIGNVLRAVSSSLETVIGSVSAIPDKTDALEPVLTSINADLATARGVLEGLLAKKLGAPAGSPPVDERTAGQAPPPVPEPAPAVVDVAAAHDATAEPGSERIQWRAGEDPTTRVDPEPDTVSEPEAAEPAVAAAGRLRWPPARE